nr:MAG TPA: hypothetical protein [Caudoviricetes sp.]
MLKQRSINRAGRRQNRPQESDREKINMIYRPTKFERL